MVASFGYQIIGSDSAAELSLVPGSTAAFVLGTSIYWAYFHRYEVHMHVWDIISIFLLSCLAIAISGVKGYSISPAESTRVVGTFAAAFLTGSFGNCLVWRVFFNPLNRFPGQWATRISTLWFSFQLGKSDGYYKLQALHKKYGKFLRVGVNELSISHPDAVEAIYSTKADTRKADWYDGDAPFQSMHTTRDRALHDRRRRVWAPAFSEKALREYEIHIKRLNDVFLDKMGELQGQAADMTKWFNLYSFDAMGLIAFGKEYHLLEKGEKPEALRMLDEGLAPLAFRLPIWLFRIMVAIPGAGAGFQKFIKYCADETAWRVNKMSEKNADGDILGWLLKAYKDIRRPEKDVGLQADARLIIVAGSDTTAATFTYLFYHLAQNSHVVENLHKELDPLTKGEFSDIDIRNADYLNACINESLRLHPPVPSGWKRLTPPEGMHIANRFIPGDTTVFVPAYVVGRDADVYAEPDTFLPERWTTQSEKIKQKDAFAPFSIGTYGCIGKNLALMELRTLTARLLKVYNVGFAPGEDGTAILTQTKDHFTVGLGDLNLVFTPRK